MTNPQRCEVCLYFHPEQSQVTPTKHCDGICRRRAPIEGPRNKFTQIGEPLWPPTDRNLWCGEFEPT